jgi:hypothetical protein
MESVNLKYRREESRKGKNQQQRVLGKEKGNLTKKARIKSFALDKYSTKL